MPEPGAGQVRVRMLMSPVNPSDLNFVRGTYFDALRRIVWNQPRDGEAAARAWFDPDRTNACPMPPYALGGEGVGIVEACGSGFLARRLRGKRVAVASGPPHGTWQEHTLVDAKKAVALPASVPDDQAAMFFVNPITAYVLIHEVLRVRRGGWVLVTAAGSALRQERRAHGPARRLSNDLRRAFEREHRGVAGVGRRRGDRDRPPGPDPRSRAHHGRARRGPCARLRRRRTRGPGRSLPRPGRPPRDLRHARGQSHADSRSRPDDARGARLGFPAAELDVAAIARSSCSASCAP